MDKVVSLKYSKEDGLAADFSIDEKYFVRSGDERFYKMVGNTSLFSINKLIHPDDRKEFEEFIEAGVEAEYCVARLLLRDNRYRWITFIKQIIRVDGDERFVDIGIQDVVAISHNFDVYYSRMKKYRAVINMLEDKLFEYEHKNGMFTIYCYRNNRSEVIEKMPFTEWKAYVERMGFIENGSKDNFNVLCQSILAGVDSFSMKINSSMMSKGERRDKLRFKGQTVMNGSEKIITIGIITELDRRMTATEVQLETGEGVRDSATGLFNKKAITDKIMANINIAASNEKISKNMYLCIFDIDNFKQVNDTYGHYFGDEVIKTFANGLNTKIAEKGIVGRIGGDEFIALIADVDEEELRDILRNVKTSVREHLHEVQPTYTFSTSIGISRFPENATDYETLFKLADACLYLAKEKGKDRYIIYYKPKHGDLLNQDVSERKVSTGRGFLRPIDKYIFAAEQISHLKSHDDESIKSVLDALIDKLNIHGIRIFTGADMKCRYYSGHYKQDASKTSALYLYDEAYIKSFSDTSINIVYNVEALSVDNKDVYDLMKSMNICSLLQIFDDINGEKVLAEFDIFGTDLRKWNSDDVNVLKMIVMEIANSLR